MNPQLCCRIESLGAMWASMNRSICHKPAVVSERMTLADNLAFAAAPFCSTQIAKLRATMASNVIATSPLLNNVATLKASHPIHFPAELGHVVNDL
jgi:hypothetical protein